MNMKLKTRLPVVLLGEHDIRHVAIVEGVHDAESQIRRRPVN